jgi:HSP20 family protein
MEQLTRWIPANWRTSLAQLRDEIYGIVERWLPRRHNNGSITRNGNVPRRFDMTVEDNPLWTPSRLIVNSPRLDVNETDDEVVVTAELPGYEANDFAIEITAERLVLRGEQQHESHRAGYGYTYSKRQYGAFAQALRLPCEVNPDKAQATYKHGVLRVTMPKTAQSRARRMKIAIQA